MLPFIRVEEYVAKDGSSPFADWFNSIDCHAAAKVNTYLTRIAHGNLSSLKPLKGALQEVVIDWGPGYRVYVGRDGNSWVILLGGGTTGVINMPLTQSFKKTVQARAVKDRVFREGLLRESIECMLAGDIQTGKALLRDYINATTGFEKLARMTSKDSKSVMRMLSPAGNPTANNLFDILHVLQKTEGVHYELQAV